jgi:triosephosphate isomerase
MNNIPLIIGTNLKMYKNSSDTTAYLSKLIQITKEFSDSDIKIFVIPSFTSIPAASQILLNNSIMLGAQNMHWEDSGAFTGEISPKMLEEFNVKIIEIAHSERRHIFNESDEIANKKVLSALSHGFVALLCIGETKDQKESNIADETLQIQLKIGLKNVSTEQIDRIWIAYEPVWAIGEKGIPAYPNYVSSKHKIIKETLIQLFGDEGRKIPVLYGGSVNLSNIKGLISEKNVDGLFVGRAAWDPKGIELVIQESLNTRKRKL